MKEKVNSLIFILFTFIFSFITLFNFELEVVSAKEIDPNIFVKKISKDYTNKFCNAIAFGLSKESAMKFSIEENKKTFEKRKATKNINKELLAEEIAISIVEKCGYPINLTGEKGIKEFKIYYLKQEKES